MHPKTTTLLGCDAFIERAAILFRKALELSNQSMSKSIRSFRKVLMGSAGFVQQFVCERFHHVRGPFHDDDGRYARCIDCGRRIAWDEPE
jgi:hypothetical protein